jgi:hypothetical protein
LDDINTLKAELERLRREYATFVIEVWHIASEPHPEGFEAPGVLDGQVGALLEAAWRCDVGECEQCGAWAPLRPRPVGIVEGSEPVKGTQTCAWGCSK